jgi:amidase
MSKHWTELVEEKRARLQASIPKEWLINIPPDNVLDITAIPERCGLLSAKEIEITNTHVEGLLEKLAKAEWSALEVVTAFSKRAIIAHQLVNLNRKFHSVTHLPTDQLLDGSLRRTCHGSGKGTR